MSAELKIVISEESAGQPPAQPSPAQPALPASQTPTQTPAVPPASAPPSKPAQQQPSAQSAQSTTTTVAQPKANAPTVAQPAPVAQTPARAEVAKPAVAEQPPLPLARPKDVAEQPKAAEPEQAPKDVAQTPKAEAEQPAEQVARPKDVAEQPKAAELEQPPKAAVQPLKAADAEPAAEKPPEVEAETKPDIFNKRPEFVTAPERRFTQEQWEAIKPEDREALSKQMGMAPPKSVEQADLFREQQGDREPPERIKEAAKKRLDRHKDAEQVEQEMRRQDPDYRAEAEGAEEKRKLRQAIEERRLAYERMTQEERDAFDANALAERQARSERVKAMAAEMRGESPANPGRTAEEEAARLQEREERKREVDRIRRANDPLYAATQKVADDYRETAKELRESNEVRRRERLQLEQMSAEERIEFLAKKEASRRDEAARVKARADELLGVEQKKPAEFDPYAQADKMRESQVRKEQVKAAHEEKYGGEKSALDVGLDFAQDMRGTIGGTFGRLAGAGLDVMAAVRKLQKSPERKEAERRNAELKEQKQRQAAAQAEAKEKAEAPFVTEIPEVTAAPEAEQPVQDYAHAYNAKTGEYEMVERADVDKLPSVRPAPNEGGDLFGRETAPDGKKTTEAYEPAAEQPTRRKTGGDLFGREKPQVEPDKKTTEAYERPAETPAAPEASAEQAPSTLKAAPEAAAQPAPSTPKAAPEAAAEKAPAAPKAAPEAAAQATPSGETAAGAGEAVASGGAEAGAAAGLGEVAAMAGPAAAAIGVAGVEAVKALRDVSMGFVRIVGEAGASMATFKDGSARISEFGDNLKGASDKLIWVSPALSFLAGVAGEAASQVAKLDDAVKGTAERLGQYNGGLAAQNAMQEVQETMRDIERAGRFGEATQGANEARFNMEQKIADITDRFIPLIMPIAEGIFKAVEFGAGIVDTGFKATLETLIFLIEIVQKINPLAWVGPIADKLEGIKQTLKDANGDRQNDNEVQLWNQFMSMRQNVVTGVNVPAPAPGAVVQ